MSLEITMHSHDGMMQVELNGSFTFSHYGEFQNIFRRMEELNPKELRLSLAELAYIDSSGLGMMLLMREKCQQKGCVLQLMQPRGQVKKMFDVAQLNDVFLIEP